MFQHYKQICFHIFTELTHFRATVIFQNYWIMSNNNARKLTYKTTFWEIIFMNYLVKI